VPERSPERPGGLPSAAALAAGAGVVLGVLDVTLLHGPVFTDRTVFLATVALAGAVHAGIAVAGALGGALIGRVAGLILGRRLPGFGVALAGGLVAAPALMALEQAHRSSAATVTSPTGLLITAGVAAAALALVVVVARPLQRLARLPHAVAALAGALALVATLASWRPAPDPRPRADDLVLISIDSIRADDWRAFTEQRSTPALRGFLDDSTEYTAARTTWSHSLPSHASVLTGRWPVDHGARIVTRTPRPGPWAVAGSPLRPEVSTLATLLSDQGYQTAEFYDNAWLGPPFGLERGFQTQVAAGKPLQLGLAAPGLSLTAFGAGQTLSWARAHLPEGRHASIALALDWWHHRDPARPAFMFVHLIELHVPHDPAAAALAGEGDGGPFAGVSGHRMQALLDAGKIPDDQRAAAIAHLHRLSRARLSEVDAMLAPLLQALTDDGTLAIAPVVLFGDHGDDLYEHAGVYSHAHVYDGVARVPLVVHLPDRGTQGRREAPVSLVDVAPTLLAAVGHADLADGMDGVDLATTTADALVHRPLLVQGHDAFSSDVHSALVQGDRKLIRLADGSVQLYDVADDPGEQHDLAEADPARVEQLDAALDALLPAGGEAPAVLDGDALPDDVREQLRGLGYIE